MRRADHERGMTLIELLVASLILILIGLGLVTFIRSAYSSQDIISGENAAAGSARTGLDSVADNIRNAQWYTGGSYPSAIQSGNATSITVYNFDPVSGGTDGTRTTAISLSGGNLVKSVNGGTPMTVVSGVQSLSIRYYRASDWTEVVNPGAADLPTIGAVDLTVNLAVALMGTYTRQYTTFIRLRNSPPRLGV